MYRGLRITFALALVLAALPAAALADSTDSTNWSGYVAHRAGLKFRAVTATWTQPSVTCTVGAAPSASSTWVGLGGYNQSSSAIEQIGTERDCSRSGHTTSLAWYELIPAPAKPIAMQVRPGDVMFARVAVRDHVVTMKLIDRTRGKFFSKTVVDGTPDVSSAEWIVEAPSQCDFQGNCQTLPLADFGSVRVRGAAARTSAGVKAPISSALWHATSVRLLPDPGLLDPTATAGISTPSPLFDAGSAFDVSYSQTAASALPSMVRASPRILPSSSPR
jgi:Peptidase A4 family